MRILLALLFGLIFTQHLRAAEDQPDASLEEYSQRITAELRAIDPEAAKLFEEANAARDKKDLANAERLYRAVLERQPDWHHAKRRLAGVISDANRRPEALKLAREALATSRCSENRGALIQLLLNIESKDEKYTQAELQEAVSLGREILADPSADSFSVFNAGNAALNAQDVNMLRTAVARLALTKPDLPQRHFLAWIVAMDEGDFSKAQKSINHAVQAGLDPALTARMQTTLSNMQPWYERYWGTAWRVIVWWVAIFAGLFVAGLVLSAFALRASDRIAHTPAEQELSGMGLMGVLYRVVMWTSCGFYYLSVPLVLLVVAAVPVAVIYGCLAAGRIPIKLVLIVVIFALVTLWSVVKSLLVRGGDSDPGDDLPLETQPRFRQVLEDLAHRLNTRPVDRVFLTPGTEVAVVERGSLRRQISHQTERCLILGLGVLDGMRVGALRAVLAHEYGHFVNRDTAGGGFALAVRRSLMMMAYNMASGGVATWYNPGWLFLNGFYRVFLLISHGASRLQEVLADRWAAITVGAAAFEEGLRHVIQRSVMFDAHANATLNEVVSAHKPLTNLYQYQPAKTKDPASVEREVSKALKAKPTAYDTHPAPLQRFQWAHACNAASNPAPGDEQEAWTLFDNREVLEQKMTERLRAEIALNGVRIRGK